MDLWRLLRPLVWTRVYGLNDYTITKLSHRKTAVDTTALFKTHTHPKGSADLKYKRPWVHGPAGAAVRTSPSPSSGAEQQKPWQRLSLSCSNNTARPCPCCGRRPQKESLAWRRRWAKPSSAWDCYPKLKDFKHAQTNAVFPRVIHLHLSLLFYSLKASSVVCGTVVC